MHLSTKQIECLHAAAGGVLSSWDFGGGTLGSLKRAGLVIGRAVTVHGRRSTAYALTPAGVAALDAIDAPALAVAS